MSGLNQKGPIGNGPGFGRRMGKCSAMGVKQRNEGQSAQDQNSSFQPNHSVVDNTSESGIGRGFRLMGKGRGRGRNADGPGMGRRLRHRFGNNDN
jgi:hypothetical protein